MVLDLLSISIETGGLWFFENWPVFNILSGIFAHYFSKLGKRIWTVLLIIDGNCRIMTEIYSADS
jgi:hypothetical protein